MLDLFNFDWLLYKLIYIIPAFLIALSIHEFAHAAVAYSLGDKTASDQGRFTLNPVSHIDVLGLLMLLVTNFGWAKPVPFNPYNFRGNREKGIILVSLAGPLSNFITAVIGTILLYLFLVNIPYVNMLIQVFISVNVMLAVFNLLPLPPLDGSKILTGLLPASRQLLYSLEQYGTIVLVLLLFTGILSKILNIFMLPINYLLNWVAIIITQIF